jgi:hypothetical protein
MRDWLMNYSGAAKSTKLVRSWRAMLVTQTPFGMNLIC